MWSDSTTVLHWLEDNGEYKKLLVIGWLKSKKNVLSNGNKFLRLKLQPILGVKVEKCISLTINGGKAPSDSKIKRNSLNNQKLKITKNLEIEKKKIKKILATTFTTENMFDKPCIKILAS